MDGGPDPLLALGAWAGEVIARRLPSAGTAPPFRGNSGSCSWFAAGPSSPRGAGPRWPTGSQAQALRQQKQATVCAQARSLGGKSSLFSLYCTQRPVRRYRTGHPGGVPRSPRIHIMAGLSSTEVQCRLRSVCPARGRHLGLHVSAGGEAAPSAGECAQTSLVLMASVGGGEAQPPAPRAWSSTGIRSPAGV